MGLDNDLYTLLHGGWDTSITEVKTPAVPATSGYQEFGLTGITAETLTGLSGAGTATYDFNIQIDGAVAVNCSIDDYPAWIANCQNLIDSINSRILTITASIVGGDIRITSKTSGVLSSISLSDGGEYPLLSYLYDNVDELPVDLDDPVAGVAEIPAVMGAIISEPTLHNNLDPIAPMTHHLFIQTTDMPSKVGEASNDMSMQEKTQRFVLTGFEASEDDCLKCIKICKKLILNASVANGLYAISEVLITEKSLINKYEISGFLNKLIEDDDF